MGGWFSALWNALHKAENQPFKVRWLRDRNGSKEVVREATYPWRNEDVSPRSAIQDLAEARRLIEKHGYWRRKEELEDAEAVIGKLV
jgi:hypothetical protein